MPDNCPICETELREKRPGTVTGYDCPRCGPFVMSDRTKGSLQARILRGSEEGRDPEEQRAVISHSIRRMYKKDEDPWPPIDNQLIEAVSKNPLPNVAEQADNLIIWFAENGASGREYSIQPSMYQSIIGVTSPEGVGLILRHLLAKEFIETRRGMTFACHGQGMAILSFRGWQHYEQLKRGAVNSRKAFMAMEYGNEELDEIVDECFKPAVADTGFELYRLNEKPRAGLIDDRLRVEIRNSRFLISDLTHDNRGAYWEAGYAEGLGKPVIYTCKKDVFNKTHFDTNHHLTVIWDAANLQEAANELKATIRATLPDEAKLSDD